MKTEPTPSFIWLILYWAEAHNSSQLGCQFVLVKVRLPSPLPLNHQTSIDLLVLGVLLKFQQLCIIVLMTCHFLPFVCQKSQDLLHSLPRQRILHPSNFHLRPYFNCLRRLSYIILPTPTGAPQASENKKRQRHQSNSKILLY